MNVAVYLATMEEYAAMTLASTGVNVEKVG